MKYKIKTRKKMNKTKAIYLKKTSDSFPINRTRQKWQTICDSREQNKKGGSKVLLFLSHSWVTSSSGAMIPCKELKLVPTPTWVSLELDLPTPVTSWETTLLVISLTATSWEMLNLDPNRLCLLYLRT